MRILVVATKLPWPANDGGRLALWWTLRGLADAGHEIALVAPTAIGPDADTLARLRGVGAAFPVAVTAPSWPLSAWRARRERQALTIARHRHPAVAATVAQLVQSWSPDVVHVEQLQAWANARPARDAGLPCVLRAQNVEASLWAQAARRGGFARWLAAEAARVSRDEKRAVDEADLTLAITARDVQTFDAAPSGIAAARVAAWSPPFPPYLDAGQPRDGEPAIAVAGSGGWWPNREGLHWFLREVAPALATRWPASRVHVFGASTREPAPNLSLHPAPHDAVDAFPRGAICAVPLLSGSGIRMRILEAWARGLPVVATTVAAAGLEVRSGCELLIADTPREFVEAVSRLHADAALAASLVDAGRRHLRREHEPARQTEALLAHYHAAIARRAPDRLDAR